VVELEERSLKLLVNGSEREIPSGAVIKDLIKDLDLIPDRVAVELNGKIIKRLEWDSTTLSEGDKLEIVHFVGGGEDQVR
jgi:thiamine biosynthesis protein ThiS